MLELVLGWGSALASLRAQALDSDSALASLWAQVLGWA